MRKKLIISSLLVTLMLASAGANSSVVEKFDSILVASNLKPSSESVKFLGLVKGSLSDYVKDVRVTKVGTIISQDVQRVDKASSGQSAVNTVVRTLHYNAQKFCSGSTSYFLDNFDVAYSSTAWASNYSKLGGGSDTVIVTANALCID